MLLIHRNVIFYCIDITIMLPIHIQVSLYLLLLDAGFFLVSVCWRKC